MRGFAVAVLMVDVFAAFTEYGPGAVALIVAGALAGVILYDEEAYG